MTVDIDDTIAAIASAEGNAIRGIVRITGPQTIACVENSFGIKIDSRQTVSVELPIQDGNETISLAGQLLVWPDDRSYTRQPSAEFHTIGSGPLLELALARFCECGLRIARPGEFTMRAFLGGRLDLTQAEAVLAVIDSTEQQHFELALQQLAGGLATPLDKVRDQLIDLLAELEAGLDFVEEDIEFVSRDQIIQSIGQSLKTVEQIEKQISSRGLKNNSYDVALIGWPNVGKSSLFNAMLFENRAIVADVAGTTRDYISSTTERNGLKVRLIDTAGLEDALAGHELSESQSLLKQLVIKSNRTIEAAAQNASLEQLANSQLKLICLDGSRDLNAGELRLVDELKEDISVLFVVTKCDLKRKLSVPIPYIETTVNSGATEKVSGIGGLWDQVCQRLIEESGSDISVIGSTLVRCGEHIGNVLGGLMAARNAAEALVGEEIIAAELRHSIEHLGQIVGTVYTDDILDRIFGRFCIGK